MKCLFCNKETNGKIEVDGQDIYVCENCYLTTNEEMAKEKIKERKEKE